MGLSITATMNCVRPEAVRVRRARQAHPWRCRAASSNSGEDLVAQLHLSIDSRLMSISSDQLEAFVAVVQHRHFTRAARAVGLTQSALSQRVLNLEQALGAQLLIRGRSGIELTFAGGRLLAYARAREELEGLAVGEIRGEHYRRTLRIGGFSSITASLLIPIVGLILKDEPELDVECITREMRDLPGLLLDGKTDYIVTDRALSLPRVVHQVLAYETNVLVESTRKGARADVYLDHDADDGTTESFFRAQRHRPESIKRAFLDDIDGILAGVQSGWGRAVVPKHLLVHAQSKKTVRLVPGYLPLKTPIVLHYLKRDYPTDLHARVVRTLESELRRLLP
jgi:DNA-binding transcriptional LysR family regulator